MFFPVYHSRSDTELNKWGKLRSNNIVDGYLLQLFHLTKSYPYANTLFPLWEIWRGFLSSLLVGSAWDPEVYTWTSSSLVSPLLGSMHQWVLAGCSAQAVCSPFCSWKVPLVERGALFPSSFIYYLIFLRYSLPYYSIRESLLISNRNIFFLQLCN